MLELADAFHNHCQRLAHYVSMDNFTLWRLLIADYTVLGVLKLSKLRGFIGISDQSLE